MKKKKKKKKKKKELRLEKYTNSTHLGLHITNRVPYAAKYFSTFCIADKTMLPSSLHIQLDDGCVNQDLTLFVIPFKAF